MDTTPHETKTTRSPRRGLMLALGALVALATLAPVATAEAGPRDRKHRDNVREHHRDHYGYRHHRKHHRNHFRHRDGGFTITIGDGISIKGADRYWKGLSKGSRAGWNDGYQDARRGRPFCGEAPPPSKRRGAAFRSGFANGYRAAYANGYRRGEREVRRRVYDYRSGRYAGRGGRYGRW